MMELLEKFKLSRQGVPSAKSLSWLLSAGHVKKRIEVATEWELEIKIDDSQQRRDTLKNIYGVGLKRQPVRFIR
jgi:hypothetical protein